MCCEMSFVQFELKEQLYIMDLIDSFVKLIWIGKETRFFGFNRANRTERCRGLTAYLTTISTLRFLPFPSSVALLATGERGPTPLAWMFEAGTL